MGAGARLANEGFAGGLGLLAADANMDDGDVLWLTELVDWRSTSWSQNNDVKASANRTEPPTFMLTTVRRRYSHIYCQNCSTCIAMPGDCLASSYFGSSCCCRFVN
jgi:hypothetical protein